MLRRIMLFISSYTPLYVLLILKNVAERTNSLGNFLPQIKSAHFFDEINDYAIAVLLIMTIVSVAYLFRLTKKTDGSHKYVVKEINDQTGTVYFNYISVYLLSCIGLSLNNAPDVLIFVFLMLLIGFIYVSNRMTYMNPVLQLFQYRIYEGTLYSPSTQEELKNVIVVCPKEVILEESKSYIGSVKDDFINITAAD